MIIDVPCTSRKRWDAIEKELRKWNRDPKYSFSSIAAFKELDWMESNNWDPPDKVERGELCTEQKTTIGIYFNWIRKNASCTKFFDQDGNVENAFFIGNT